MKYIVSGSVLFSMALCLSACSGGGSSGNATAPQIVNPDSLSEANYTKSQDLTSEQYSQVTSNLGKTCKGFDQFVRPGALYRRQISTTKPNGSINIIESDTISSVRANSVQGTTNYEQINISGYSGQVLDQNPIPFECKIEKNQSRYGDSQNVSCETQTKLSQSFNEFRQNRSDLFDNCDYSSSEQSQASGVTDITKYETGTLRLTDGKSVRVFVTRMQHQVTEKCDSSKTERQVVMTSVSMQTADVTNYSDLECGSTWVYEHQIVQDLSNRLVSDFSMTVLSAPLASKK